MRKLVFAATVIFMMLQSFGQVSNYDKIFKHSGEIIEAKVTKIGEVLINYKPAGEDIERTIGRLAVKKIEYHNGTSETISDEIIINGKKGWKEVQIILEKDALSGLKKGGEIFGKASYWSRSTVPTSRADKKSDQALQETAAKQNAPFVLLTSDHGNLKKGIFYNYK